MRLAFWLAWRNVRSHPLPTLCAILGVAFGVATVAAVRIVDHSTVVGVREYHRRFTGTPDLLLRIRDLRKSTPQAALALLESDPRISTVMPVLTERASLGLPGGASLDVILVGLDPTKSLPFDAYRVFEGEDLGASNGLLLGTRAAQDLRIALGSKVALRRPAVTPSGCVGGEIVEVEAGTRPPGPPIDAEIRGLLEKRYLGSANSGRIVIAPYAFAVDVLAGAGFDPEFWVRLAPGVSRAALTQSLGASFVLDEPQAKEVAETGEERAFRSGVMMASFLSFGLGLFVIFHLLTLTVTSWMRQAGLLGALGVTSRGLARVFLAEALLLAGSGSILGLGLGVGLAQGLIAAKLTTLGWGRPVAAIEIPWADLAWVPFVGLATGMLGAVLPVTRIARVATLDALTQGPTAMAKAASSRWLAPVVLGMAPLTALSLAWSLRWIDESVLQVSILLSAIFGVFVLLLFAIPGVFARVFGAVLRPFVQRSVVLHLARRNLETSLRRFAGSVTGLALVAAGIVGLHALVGSLKEEADAFARRATPRHVYLKLPYVARADLEALRSIPGVTGIVPIDATYRSDGMELRGVSAPDLFSMGLFAGASEARRRALFAEGRGIVVSSGLARERRLEAGQVVDMRTYSGTLALEVLAVSDEFGFYPSDRRFALLEETTMKRVFCRSNERPHGVIVGVDREERESEVLAAFISALKIRYPGDQSEGQTGADHRRHLQDEIDHDFRIFDVILGLTAVLAALGLMNSLLVSGLERTRELGLLRALGLERRQIVMLFLVEGVALGLAGGLLGCLMGLPFGAVTVEGLTRLAELPLEHQITPTWLVGALLIILIASAAAAILPALRAGRTDVIAALEYE